LIDRPIFGLDNQGASATGSTLKDAMRRTVVAWHPSLRKLVEMIDEQLIVFPLSVIAPEWGEAEGIQNPVFGEVRFKLPLDS
jgi:hypothetical protein